jgi:glutathione peroxidase
MNKTIFDITVKTINGEEKQLSEYGGNVLLIVNLASYCGYTPQYKGLEQLNLKYHKSGLRVLGFPCNDYGQQEPGTNEQIKNFCSRNYSVSFDIFEKVHAKGSQQHPLYKFVTSSVEPRGDVSWNFEKFLVNKKGGVIARFRSSVSPESPELITAIEQELAK